MGEKTLNILEYFRKLNDPVSKKYLISEVKREWSGIWKTLFLLLFFPVLSLFVFFLLSDKKSSPSYRHFRSQLLHYTVCFFFRLDGSRYFLGYSSVF